MINSVYEELELTPKLIQFGVKKIVRQGNKALGYSMMVVVNWHDVDRAFRFDVEKKWKKTIENYDREIMGIGFHDTLKAEIRMFMVEKSAEIIGYDRREAAKYEEPEEGEEGSPKEMSVSKAAHTHSGRVMLKGMIVGASKLYQLVNHVKWRCLNCNNLHERDVKNILEPPSTPKECAGCESKELEPMHEFKNAISLSLQEEDIQQQQNALDNLEAVVFDDDTNDIQVGECGRIIGDIKKRQDPKTKHYRTVILVHSIQYEHRQKLELTPAKIKAINRFVTSYPKYKQRMVSMFAPNVVGCTFQKFALILSAIGAPEKRKTSTTKGIRGRVHSLMIGPPGTGKTLLGKEAIQLRLNSKYVSGKNTTGKSMTAMVLPENESLQLHIGPVPLAKNAICLINEFDKVPTEDQDNLLEVMDEGTIDVNKFAKQLHISSPTTIVATANPRNNKWISTESIDIEEIPFSSIMLNRFDIILTFRDTVTEKEARDYAYAKTEWDQRDIEHNYRFLQTVIEYQKKIKPVITLQADGLLNEYYVKIKQQANFASNNRTLDIIHRVAKTIARFYLKSEVDEDIATKTIDFMNQMLTDFHLSIYTVPDPFVTTYEETIKVIQSATASKDNVRGEPIMVIEEAISMARERNEQVKYYLGPVLAQNKNRKIRSLCTKILENRHVVRVSEHPTRVIWNPEPELNSDKNIGNEGGVSDIGDIGDSQNSPTTEKNEKNFSKNGVGDQFSVSPASPMSPSESITSDVNNVVEQTKEEEVEMPPYVHRRNEHSDIWVCDFCKVRSDRHDMKVHFHPSSDMKQKKTKPKTSAKATSKKMAEAEPKPSFEKLGGMYQCDCGKRFYLLRDYERHLSEGNHMEWK